MEDGDGRKRDVPSRVLVPVPDLASGDEMIVDADSNMSLNCSADSTRKAARRGLLGDTIPASGEETTAIAFVEVRVGSREVVSGEDEEDEERIRE